MNKLIWIFLLFSQVSFAQLKQLTLEDAVWRSYSQYRPESLNGLTWKNENSFTWVKNDTLWMKTVQPDEKFSLIDLPGLNHIIKSADENEFKRFPSYSWTKNENLLIKNSGQYLIVDPEKGRVAVKINLPGNAENDIFCEEGNFVAFTIADNLFMSDSSGKISQITFDGGNGIVNGKSVHRNEFGISKGIFNSPKGNFIAFYRMDESMVADYPLVDFMTREAEYTPVKYPMAGMTSHQVTLGIYNISTGKTVFLKTGETDDHYLTNISWSPDEKTIYMAELNRAQNHMQLNAYDVNSGERIKMLFEEKSDTYVEPLFPVQFSKLNENEFFYLSRRDGWFHICKYNTNGELIQQITKGEWEVTNILGFDKKEKYVFVEATKEHPLENHIYKVEVKSGKMDKLTADEGVHHGIISPEAGFILDKWNASDIPGRTDLISITKKLVTNVHTSPNPLYEFQLGENSLVTLKTADGKHELYGRLIKPVNFDAGKKYPVVVYVYGGPHSQLVDKSWLNAAQLWQYYMASQGFISFTLDNRGTNNRGSDFETSIHRRLGVLETEDQMQGIEYLKSLPFVDDGRIGVYGWSYGGFMTLNLMLRHPEVFRVGVAGGPVVDWSMYEVMYGERYMDTPQENPTGYNESNMINHVSKLDGKLMLIHGVQDETVVMQHSMKFLNECIKQEKQVDFFVYPTHPHNVRGKDRIHLMEKVSRYFIENL